MTKIIGDSALLDTWAATGTQSEPSEGKKNSGWADGERPAYDFMNFIQAEFGEKLNHILANGVPAWNATTAYGANVFSSRAGVIYRSLTANTNSQPPSVNWSPIAPDVTDIIGVVFSGMRGDFAMTTAPDGWLKANGQAVSRVTYARLFSRIGTIYGVGNGSTTFNLPEWRGEFVRGLDDGRGVDIGRTIGSAQSDLIKSHTHTVRMGSDVNGVIPWNNGKSVSTSNESLPANAGTSQVESFGGGETRPRNVALLACIKW